MVTVAYHLCLIILAGGAAWMDIREHRIKNFWHILFWILGLAWQIWRIGLSGILYFAAGVFAPIFCLFPLFRWRMLGAGDIKLFSTLGGFMGIWSVLRCMVCSFLIGGIISLCLVCRRGILPLRLKYFCSFFQANSIFQCFDFRSKLPAYRQKKFGAECIHFSVPVFLAVLLRMGGLY